MTTVAVTFAGALVAVLLAGAAVCGAAIIVFSGRVACELMAFQTRIDRRYGVTSAVAGAHPSLTVGAAVWLVTLVVGAGWVFAGILGLYFIIIGRFAS